MNILLRTYCLLDAAAIKALNELLRYQQTIRMHLAALLKAIEQGSELIVAVLTAYRWANGGRSVTLTFPH